MRMGLMSSLALLCVALPLSAAPIGPFGTLNGAPAYWETPVAPSQGIASVQDPGSGPQLLESPAGAKVQFLPWNVLDAAYANERMTMARLNLTGSVDNVHAKVFDPATTGKHGWQVILVDSDGKALWFGVQTSGLGNTGPGKINGYQWDGGSWTYPSAYNRPRGGEPGDEYYTMDFVQLASGKIQWTISGVSSLGNQFLAPSSFETDVVYGDITEVYLSTSTYDNSNTTYKWTEFSAVPEPATLSLLAIGLLGLMRRRA